MSSEEGEVWERFKGGKPGESPEAVAPGVGSGRQASP